MAEDPPPEVRAQAGAGGPIATLAMWLGATRVERDGALAMSLMTPDRRRGWAEDFVEAAQRGVISEPGFQVLVGHDDVAALAAGDTRHLFYESFCSGYLAVMDVLLTGWPPELGFGSQPRPVDANHEVVLVGDAGKGESRPTMNERAALGAFLMRHSPETATGWLVADWDLDGMERPWWRPA